MIRTVLSAADLCLRIHESSSLVDVRPRDRILGREPDAPMLNAGPIRRRPLRRPDGNRAQKGLGLGTPKHVMHWEPSNESQCGIAPGSANETSRLMLRMIKRYTACSAGFIPRQVQAARARTSPPFTFAFDALDDDIRRMSHTGVVEPMLTHAWHELTWRCCKRPGGGLVVDVGANYGWYTLFSLALGCSVVAFEPVPAFAGTLRQGLKMNPGFEARAEIHQNVVYSAKGRFPLRVPVPRHYDGVHFKKLGMAGLYGAHGVLKADYKQPLAYNVSTTSVRLDDVIDIEDDKPICMLKADVEGYEVSRRPFVRTQNQTPTVQMPTRSAAFRCRHRSCEPRRGCCRRDACAPCSSR